MRWLQLAEVLELHRRLIDQSGGMAGIRDLGLLEASLAQPRQTFGGIDLYPELIEKAAALGFSLIQNHPFVDGNKRIGHAAMEITLATPYPARTNLPRTCSRSERLAGSGDPRSTASIRSTR
jgi:death-on-curing protein